MGRDQALEPGMEKGTGKGPDRGPDKDSAPGMASDSGLGMGLGMDSVPGREMALEVGLDQVPEVDDRNSRCRRDTWDSSSDQGRIGIVVHRYHSRTCQLNSPSHWKSSLADGPSCRNRRDWRLA